jgi:O-antigen ligase
MMQLLFFLGIIAIPFSGVTGFSFLGEMQHELSAYIFIIAIGIFILSRLAAAAKTKVLFDAYLLPTIMLVVLSVIAISFFTNAFVIIDSHFRGRYGIEKFFSSILLILYGFALAHLAFSLVDQRWNTLIVRPIAISVAICAFFSIFEVMSWWSGSVASFYSMISPLVHHSGLLDIDVAGRLRSVTFEPPAFATYAGFSWPWIFSRVFSTQGLKKLIYAILGIVLSVMMILAVSRTAVILLASNIVILIALRFIYLPVRRASTDISHIISFIIICAIVGFCVYAGFNVDKLRYVVVTGENLSNVSRLASNTAAFNMFLDNKFFGFGFGQYGFHASQYMPSWGYNSWEIRSWLTDYDAVWPPVFSIYARFAAELGILGVIMWLGIWIWLARKILLTTLVYQKITGILPFQAYPLIMSCYCVLFAGIPLDSLRSPMIWITMGLSCQYLKELRLHLRSMLAKSTIEQAVI